MTTVAQLVTYLNTLPQDATVDVLVEKSASWSTYTTWEDLHFEDNIEYFDYGNTLRLGND